VDVQDVVLIVATVLAIAAALGWIRATAMLGATATEARLFRELANRHLDGVIDMAQSCSEGMASTRRDCAARLADGRRCVQAAFTEAAGGADLARQMGAGELNAAFERVADALLAESGLLGDLIRELQS
jgi:hypothetical protein